VTDTAITDVYAALARATTPEDLLAVVEQTAGWDSEAQLTLLEAVYRVMGEPLRTAGGAGSGFFGHHGRPGEQGGSAPELSDREYAGVQEYVSSSVALNDAIRDSVPLKKKLSAMQLRQIARLDSAIKSSPAIAQDTIYRAAPASLYGKDNWNVGDVIRDPGYLSTTSSLKAAREFKSELVEAYKKPYVILEIKVPKGTRAIDVNQVLGTEHAFYYQHELVLGRNTQLHLDAQESHGIVKMSIR